MENKIEDVEKNLGEELENIKKCLNDHESPQLDKLKYTDADSVKSNWPHGCSFSNKYLETVVLMFG